MSPAGVFFAENFGSSSHGVGLRSYANAMRCSLALVSSISTTLVWAWTITRASTGEYLIPHMCPFMPGSGLQVQQARWMQSSCS